MYIHTKGRVTGKNIIMKQRVKDYIKFVIDYLQIAFFKKPPYMINDNRLYYFLDNIRALFSGWKRDLVMCPSQIEKKVKNIYGEECTLYLRWRWEDPWSFSILKETRNAEGGGKIDFLADELFYRHKIGLSHDEYPHAERIAMTLWKEIYRYYKLEELSKVSKTIDNNFNDFNGEWESLDNEWEWHDTAKVVKKKPRQKRKKKV
jgi:hypothetical protein